MDKTIFRCSRCNHRLFDIAGKAEGRIEIKCRHCKTLHVVDLSSISSKQPEQQVQ